MNNDKTEHPIPADFMKWIDGEIDSNKQFIDDSERKGFVASAQYYDGCLSALCTAKEKYLNFLHPSPIGEAEKLVAMKFYDWAMRNGYQRDKGGYYKMGHSDNGPWPHYVRKDVCKTTEEFYAIFAATQPNPSRAGEPLDCHSEVGMTVGLIDSLMAIAHVLVQRDWDDANISEALKDVRADDDLKRIMDVGELSSAKEYIEEQRKSINTLSEALAFSNNLLKKQTERAGEITHAFVKWLDEQAEKEDKLSREMVFGYSSKAPAYIAAKQKYLSIPPTPAPEVKEEKPFDKSRAVRKFERLIDPNFKPEPVKDTPVEQKGFYCVKPSNIPCLIQCDDCKRFDP